MDRAQQVHRVRRLSERWVRGAAFVACLWFMGCAGSVESEPLASSAHAAASASSEEPSAQQLYLPFVANGRGATTPDPTDSVVISYNTSAICAVAGSPHRQVFRVFVPTTSAPCDPGSTLTLNRPSRWTLRNATTLDESSLSESRVTCDTNGVVVEGTWNEDWFVKALTIADPALTSRIPAQAIAETRVLCDYPQLGPTATRLNDQNRWLVVYPAVTANIGDLIWQTPEWTRMLQHTTVTVTNRRQVPVRLTASVHYYDYLTAPLDPVEDWLWHNYEAFELPAGATVDLDNILASRRDPADLEARQYPFDLITLQSDTAAPSDYSVQVTNGAEVEATAVTVITSSQQ